MSTLMKWKEEKSRIFSLPIEEKRKLYKSPEFYTLDTIDTWPKYAKLNSITSKNLKPEDLTEFKRVLLNGKPNKNLSHKVSLFKGDITKLEINAIVNAANTRLKAGGGVDGAIHRAAGPLLQDECDTLGGCSTGDTKVSGGYNLPAKFVIHTAGPQDGCAAKLECCYQRCLSYQQEHNIKSIAFPCISTGIYGFPNRLAAHIALRAARQYLESNTGVDRIIFCTFLPVDVDIYENLMQLYFPLE